MKCYLFKSCFMFVNASVSTSPTVKDSVLVNYSTYNPNQAHMRLIITRSSLTVQHVCSLCVKNIWMIAPIVCMKLTCSLSGSVWDYYKFLLQFGYWEMILWTHLVSGYPWSTPAHPKRRACYSLSSQVWNWYSTELGLCNVYQQYILKLVTFPQSLC